MLAAHSQQSPQQTSEPTKEVTDPFKRGDGERRVVGGGPGDLLLEPVNLDDDELAFPIPYKREIN